MVWFLILVGFIILIFAPVAFLRADGEPRHQMNDRLDAEALQKSTYQPRHREATR